MKKVIIIGGGFAGLSAAKRLANQKKFQVTLIDRRNHHLFQPLLYQVAMAGLSPADIAVPIRGILGKYKNITVLMGTAKSIDAQGNKVICDIGEFEYDYLLMACGAKHSYFGKPEWEEFAPGLKTLNQATEIRRRVLLAFERAESTQDNAARKKALTFVVVGGGPTGVELAGAIGEMSRYTLGKDFKNIDATLTRVILIENSDRILGPFAEEQAVKATRYLENLGVQVWVNSRVSHIDELGVTIGNERIEADTVLWAAGVEASSLGKEIVEKTDRQGRHFVKEDLSLEAYPNIFVAGDQANFKINEKESLPGLAPVAMQQGKYFGDLLIARENGKNIGPFKYFDKGKMATVGRSKAIAQVGNWQINGYLAWLAWLFVHLLYLVGFKNKLFVIFQWGWSFLFFKRGARLIVGKQWRFYKNKNNSTTALNDNNNITPESNEASAD